MRQLAVKAAVREVTDLGEFTAIAATYDVDRVKDQIIPGAFERTVARWRASGKKIPVHWNHSADAKDIIGAIDPATMREIPGEGLYVAGRLDLQDCQVAREAWRSMRNNAVALSFGYLATKSRTRRDRIRELLEIDLFEITVAPGPANPETRFLSLKAAGQGRVPTDAELRALAKRLRVELPPSRGELRRRSENVALEAARGWQPPPKIRPEPDAKSIPTAAEQHRRLHRLRLGLLMGDHDLEPGREAARPGPTDIQLREQARVLGIPVPRTRRQGDHAVIRAEARAQMLALLRYSDA